MHEYVTVLDVRITLKVSGCCTKYGCGRLLLFFFVVVCTAYSTDQLKGKHLPRPVRGMHMELVLNVHG